MGNADTLQQRARFFGYKRRYLGICRVFLEQGILNAFESYVEHEEFMRAELKLIQTGQQDLKTWRRRLVLDPALHPCRRNVISDGYTRMRRGGGWTQQRGALMSKDARDHNAAVLKELIKSLGWEKDTTYISNQPAQQHEVAEDVPLTKLVDALVQYRFEDPRDTASFTGLLVTFGEAIRQNPNATASVYRMRPKATAKRTIDPADGTIENFQQGRTELQGGGVAYPGDGHFKAQNAVTLHINFFDLLLSAGAKPIATDAPLLAIHIPTSLAKDWLIQFQTGQA
ncbi:MAG: Z1 domain-containing protein [Hyphomonas sp.]